MSEVSKRVDRKDMPRRFPASSYPGPKKRILQEHLAPPYFGMELLVTYQKPRKSNDPSQVLFKYSRMRDLLGYEKGGMVKSLIENRANSVMASEVVVEPCYYEDGRGDTRTDRRNSIWFFSGMGLVALNIMALSEYPVLLIFSSMVIFWFVYYFKKPIPQIAILPTDYQFSAVPELENSNYPERMEFPDIMDILPKATPIERETYWKDALFQLGMTQEQFDSDLATVKGLPERLDFINASFDAMEASNQVVGSRDAFVQDAIQDYEAAMERQGKVLKYLQSLD